MIPTTIEVTKYYDIDFLYQEEFFIRVSKWIRLCMAKDVWLYSYIYLIYVSVYVCRW